MHLSCLQACANDFVLVNFAQLKYYLDSNQVLSVILYIQDLNIIKMRAESHLKYSLMLVIILTSESSPLLKSLRNQQVYIH